MTSDMTTITVQAASSRAKPVEGITLVKFTKQHDWAFAVRFEHPMMRDLVRDDQITWLMDLASLDQVRGFEAGHLPIPATLPKPRGNKLMMANQTLEHSRVLIEALVSIISDNAARSGISIRIERNDQW